MVDQVDGVIVHTTNWDRHLSQARPFAEAGKLEVFLDDLRADDPGYDGTPFALGYRRARMG